MISPAPRHRYQDVIVTPFHDCSMGLGLGTASTPASSTFSLAPRIRLWALRLEEAMVVSKGFWLNGATVGTDSIDVGVYRMTDQSTGRLDLIRSTGAVLSAGTVNRVQESGTWKVAANNTALTSGNDSTDATTYTTASVTLKVGRLYLLSFTNTAASAAAASSISGGSGGVPTFTSRGSTQFNGTAHRNSVWSAVPTADYTGTLIINFGATQTGSTWSLNEFSGVDTATNDGCVQTVTNTGSSTTPSATLSAFGSTANATFGALANVSDTTTTPGTGFTELSDTNAATPSQCLQTEWRVDNDTSVDGTITSAAWGAIAVEIKADAGSFIIPPSTPGMTDLYMAISVSGTTATLFRSIGGSAVQYRSHALEVASVFPLPPTATGATTTSNNIPVFGFSSRSTVA